MAASPPPLRQRDGCVPSLRVSAMSAPPSFSASARCQRLPPALREPNGDDGNPPLCKTTKTSRDRSKESCSSLEETFCMDGTNQELYSSLEDGPRGKSENSNKKVCPCCQKLPQDFSGYDYELYSSISPWSFTDFDDDMNVMLRARGWPIPEFKDYSMTCKNTFDEEFGKDISHPRVKMAASKMSQCVVSLASSNGTGRVFACTGVFIGCKGSTTTRVLTSASLVRTSGDEDMIDTDLEIQVCLPTKERVKGTLQHYNLSYNVAVVSIMDFHSNHVAKFMGVPQRGVVALGRRFETGKLMATDGVLTNKQSRFNCKELRLSTCKITKAGIGGPLVDFDGKFVGMNFYDKEDTPYLPRKIILDLLNDFDSERAFASEIRYDWPVPEMYWWYYSHHLEVQPDACSDPSSSDNDSY